MSVRVQTSGLAGSAAAETKRAEPLLELPARQGSEARPTLGSDDHIELSSLSAAISAAGDAHKAQRADRIRAVGALYQTGQYQVDSSKLANAIVSEALSVHGGESTQ